MSQDIRTGVVQDDSIADVINQFSSQLGLENPRTGITHHSDSTIGIIYLANPTERYYGVLNKVLAKVNATRDKPTLVTLKKDAPRNLLDSAEGKYFLRTIAESLNINRHSISETEFILRYVPSVFGAEQQISSMNNHVVYGRRGTGKSTLMLYALLQRQKLGLPSVWIDMQQFAHRNDNTVIGELLIQIMQQLMAGPQYTSEIATQVDKIKTNMATGAHPSDETMRQSIPLLRTKLAEAIGLKKNLVLFLDDFHLIDKRLQPKLLGILYGISRGNRIFIKLSAIESLTVTWNPDTQEGMQIPHDIQVIKLDLNLTMPEKATKHIKNILENTATYCALPSILALCTSQDVIRRLVWVAAGVPRDALNTFSQAMTKSALNEKRQVSVANVNQSASEAIEDKIQGLVLVAEELRNELQALLEDIKNFCIKKQKKNAFLVEIGHDQALYDSVMKLVDLRLIHVINEGLSVWEAGRKHVALILDYGFYVGTRAARSVDLFNKQILKVTNKQLRALPIFTRTNAD